MKKIITSAIAATAIMSTAAQAEIKNVEFDGNIKFLYQTTDRTHDTVTTTDTGLFTRGNNAGTGAAFGGASAGGAHLMLGANAEVGDGYKLKFEVQALSSLGLEGNVVNTTTWGGDIEAWNTSQAYITKKLGKTNVKIGRQELNTPLLFTEKWNVGKNTFDAAVVTNSDIPNVTLVGAYVGKHNSGGANAVNYGGSARTVWMGDTTTVGGNETQFSQLGVSGAMAFAAIATPMDNLTAQLWYYNVKSSLTAIWAQADMKKIADILSVGVQYSNVDPDGLNDSTIWATKVGANVSGINVFAAYSDADKDGVAGFANLATSDKTKIYTGTGSIYMDGVVTAPGAQTFKVGAGTKVGDVKVGASYAKADDVLVSGADISAWDVKASGKVSGLNLTAIYTSMKNDTTTFGGHQMDTLRIVTVIPF